MCSKAEMAWLRMAAGCAMLRICEQKGVGDQFTAEQFYTLSTLMIVRKLITTFILHYTNNNNYFY